MSAKVLRVPFGLAHARPLHTDADRKAAASALYNLANVVDESPDRQAKAVHLYRQAVSLDPSLAIAHTNLGNCLVRLGQTEEARACYQHALTLSPEQPEAHYNLGYLALEDRRILDAVDCFAKAVRFEPRFADGHFNLAHALETIGRPEDARVAWARYLELEAVGEWADTARAHLAQLPPATTSPKPRKRNTP